MDFDVVDGPDDTVEMVLADVGRGKMHRDEGRIGPIQKPGRQAVVLGSRHPMPKGVGFDGAMMRILFKVAHQVALQGSVVATEAHEGRLQGVLGVGQPTKGKARAEPAKILIPGFGKQFLLQFIPAIDADFVHMPRTQLQWWQGRSSDDAQNDARFLKDRPGLVALGYLQSVIPLGDGGADSAAAGKLQRDLGVDISFGDAADASFENIARAETGLAELLDDNDRRGLDHGKDLPTQGQLQAFDAFVSHLGGEAVVALELEFHQGVDGALRKLHHLTSP